MYGRMIFPAIMLLMCLNASAQSVVDSFISTLDGKCSSFKYSFSVEGQFPVSGSGEVSLQGDSYTLKGNGLELYCDGSELWTLDTEAEECYVESVDADSRDYGANPALLVGAMDKAFRFQESKPAVFNGHNVTEAILSPAQKSGNIREVSLFLTPANVPAGVRIVINDGSLISVSINGWSQGVKKENEAFRLNTESLGTNYIITDLR